MRRFWIIPLVIAVGITQAQVQYFPKSSVDIGRDHFKADWYSSQLHALREPSLFSLKKSPSSESYRFLWLRTFNHPIAIRLVVQPNGTSVITSKIASGSGGFHPGVLTENNSRVLPREQTEKFLTLINKLNFWNVPNPVNDQTGTDGSQWIIEGVKGGQYHVVDRWMPKSGIVREIGMILVFDLGKLNIPKTEIY